MSAIAGRLGGPDSPFWIMPIKALECLWVVTMSSKGKIQYLLGDAEKGVPSFFSTKQSADVWISSALLLGLEVGYTVKAEPLNMVREGSLWVGDTSKTT